MTILQVGLKRVYHMYLLQIISPAFLIIWEVDSTIRLDNDTKSLSVAIMTKKYVARERQRAIQVFAEECLAREK